MYSRMIGSQNYLCFYSTFTHLQSFFIFSCFFSLKSFFVSRHIWVFFSFLHQFIDNLLLSTKILTKNKNPQSKFYISRKPLMRLAVSAWTITLPWEEIQQQSIVVLQRGLPPSPSSSIVHKDLLLQKMLSVPYDWLSRI